MEEFYENDADFFGMFEANTYDEDVFDGSSYKGFLRDENGERVLVATFEYVSENSGYGWWDSTLI